MTNERINELMGKASSISAELFEEATRIKVDTENHPWKAMENLKKIKYIEQEGIVLKKITNQLMIHMFNNILEGEDSD